MPWNTANWTWDQCQLVQELLTDLQGGVPGQELLQPWMYEEVPYDPYQQVKRQRFIKLLTEVKGRKGEDVKTIMPDIKVTVRDVTLVIKEVSGIDVRVK